jgi:phage anti-repressor protein
MNELIKINKNVIGNEEVNAVDARDLHKFLEVGDRFDQWIQRRIKEYEFVVNSDFCTNLCENTRGRPSKEYMLSMDMAKELAMAEKTAKGRQARKYFIACERKLKEITCGKTKPRVNTQAKHKPAMITDALKLITAKFEDNDKRLSRLEDRDRLLGDVLKKISDKLDSIGNRYERPKFMSAQEYVGGAMPDVSPYALARKVSEFCDKNNIVKDTSRIPNGYPVEAIDFIVWWCYRR